MFLELSKAIDSSDERYKTNIKPVTGALESIKKIIKRDNIEFDAVCTKYPSLWE